MDLALWISAGLLAFVALAGGVTKTFVPREKLAVAHGGGWTGDASTGFVKSLGILELLAAVGLLLSAALGTYLSTQADTENTARTQKAALRVAGRARRARGAFLRGAARR